MTEELEARVINWRDYHTEKDIEKLEYGELRGRAALKEAYTKMYARYEDPKGEYDFNFSYIFRDELKKIMDMYFTVYPEDAKKLVETYEQEYRGIKKIWLHWKLYWNHVEGDRYKAAKKRVMLKEKKCKE